MQLSPHIVASLCRFLNIGEVQDATMRKIIETRPVNLISLITASGPMDLAPDAHPHQKQLAIVFNAVLLRDFDSIQEMCDSLGVTIEQIDNLWLGRGEIPCKAVIESLLRVYGVDVQFLMGDSKVVKLPNAG